MPTYTFLKKDGKQFDLFMSIAEMEQYLIDNPSVQMVPGSPAIVSGVGTIKPDDGFRDFLKEAKKKNPGSNMETF